MGQALRDWERVKDAVFQIRDEQIVELDGQEPYYLAFSLEAKERGRLMIGALHMLVTWSFLERP